MAQRTKGSARFDPYWKVQWWDRTSLAWRDIQQAHQTREAAQKAAAAHWAANGEPEVRLVRISDDGQRRPEPTKIMRIPEAAAKALRTSPHAKTEATDTGGTP